ncbi:NAD-dependent protein deacetylase sirtuin-2 [Podochytrium sp. JEL0797]|nr:NAD-dependent protein deacetylase sirtuin-2 [Podochytrium sp. JEL0797]
MTLARRPLESIRALANSLLGVPRRKKLLANSSIEAFADFVQENKCHKILVLSGSGISTSAGIPDFRTPGVGLYSNLEKYNLPTPEAIFDIDFFRRNPKPFFLLAKELFPGNFKPTLSHHFIKLLSDKNLLLRNFTQNIDNLERLAGIPESHLVDAHGSFESATCAGHFSPAFGSKHPPARFHAGCDRTFTKQWLQQRVFANEIPTCPDCNGLVKPTLTFFGEPLPPKFGTHLDDFETADALIVMGSSLKVLPFGGLPAMVRNVPRLLINHEVVGDFEVGGGRDAVYLGECDEGCLRLAELWGMKDELVEMKGKVREGR